MPRIILAAVVLLALTVAPLRAATFTFGPDTFRISGDISARAGMFWSKRKPGNEWRFRTDLKVKGKYQGVSYGASTRLDVVPGSTPPVFSGLGYWVQAGKVKVSFGNTSGAVATLAGIWGCAAGYRGASCADLVTNLQPGGWQPTMTTSSSTGQGPDLVRVNFPLGKVKFAISGGGANDTEVVAKFKLRKKLSVAIGLDAGAGTTGGITVITDYSRKPWKLGVDAGHYGGVSNLVVSLEKKVKPHTWYGYVSTLNSQVSVGLSYKRELKNNVTLGMAIESVAGEFMADLGLKIKF